MGLQESEVSKYGVAEEVMEVKQSTIWKSCKQLDLASKVNDSAIDHSTCVWLRMHLACGASSK